MRAWLAVGLVGLMAVAQTPPARKKAMPKSAGPVAPEGDLGQRSPEMPPATIGGERPAVRVTLAEVTSDWPAVAAAPNGTLWVVYVEWNGKDGDRMLVDRRVENGPSGGPFALDDGSRDHYSPAIVALPDGGAVAVWSGQIEGNFELFAATISAAGKPGRVERLTRTPFSDFNARAVADAKGNVTLVWQSFRNGQADVYARRRSGAKWGPEVRVSPSIANDWEPTVALDSRGTAWISWDSYQAGNYDVFLASFDGGKASAPIAMTSDPTAQFHSSVAVDKQDRVWVAWDEADQNWGKDYSRASSVPGSRGLHFSRTLGVRVWDGKRVLVPAADIKKILTGRMSRYAELPHLAVDGAGALWMIFRHWTLVQPNEIYHFYATRLGAEGWTTPVRLAESSGQNTQHAGVATAPDGTLRVVYSSDGRSQTRTPRGDQAHALHYNVYLASLDKGEPVTPELNPVAVAPPASVFAPRRRATQEVAGKKYTLLLGDAHRHTDIRGHSGVDGSVLDTYRYAVDAAQLDWLGTSDHNEVVGGNWPDGLRDYQWWTVQKTVDLMSHPPAFIGVYSYEHSMTRPAGHRNILFLKRGAPLRMIDRTRGINAPDNQPPELWAWMEKNVFAQSGQKAVIVPHTFGAGPLADWNWPNARFDCLLEMYQGARGSYEAWRLPEKEKRGPTQVDEPGHFAQDALAKGNTYGFVSFSDHGSTHNSWAAVWSDRISREGLLDAMFARRTYAASDEIIVKASAAGHMPGEEFAARAGDPPEITASIEAPDVILRIDVVKDGKYVFTQRPEGRTASIRFRDTDARPGRSYYYIRVFQRDTEKPDGDPEIAWTSPFFVNYN